MTREKAVKHLLETSDFVAHILGEIEKSKRLGQDTLAGMAFEAREHLIANANLVRETEPEPIKFTIGQHVQGATRTFVMNGQIYVIAINERPADLDKSASWDGWRYTLPNGQSYTHPTQFGALMMCLKHLGGDKWSEV